MSELTSEDDRALAGAGSALERGGGAGRRDPLGMALQRWSRDALRRRMLAIADIGACAIASLVAIFPVVDSAWVFLLLPVWVLVAKLLGLYDRDHKALRHLTADEVPSICTWAATVTGLVAIIAAVTPEDGMDIGHAAIFLALLVVLAVGLRALARTIWWRVTPPELVALVGDGSPLASLRRKFVTFREMHLEVVEERLIPDLGTDASRTRELRSLTESVDRIVVAATGVEGALIGELKALCRRRQVKLSVVSPFRGKALSAEQTAHLADLPILEFNTWDPSRSTLLIKRLFDFSVAALGLLLLSPFLLAIAIAIKLDSPGPVMFSQIRAGIGGRPFRMYKLRSMSVDAEARLDGMLDFGELADPVFKLRDDPRVTRVGRFLRRFSLDEVPQLINVLVGEMSLVGPRPEQVELVDRYQPEHRAKLGVKPGVTGPMQIFGRGELTFHERLAIELEYVESLSLSRDLKILLHTLPAVARGTGAY